MQIWDKAGYKSANKAANGGKEIALSTMKHRKKDGMVTRTIDYIFYDDEKHLKVKGFLEPVKIEKGSDLERCGNPAADHPSDHYH